MDNKKEYFSTKQKIHLMWEYIWKLFADLEALMARVLGLEASIKDIYKKLSGLFFDSSNQLLQTNSEGINIYIRSSYFFISPITIPATPRVITYEFVVYNAGRSFSDSIVAKIHAYPWCDWYITIPPMSSGSTYTSSAVGISGGPLGYAAGDSSYIYLDYFHRYIFNNPETRHYAFTIY
jgi:hypothetical protein